MQLAMAVPPIAFPRRASILLGQEVVNGFLSASSRARLPSRGAEHGSPCRQPWKACNRASGGDASGMPGWGDGTWRSGMTNGVELDCLEGIRVVDFTQFEAGPSCTEALAWLGAEVVKIENPGLGDPGRRLQRGKPDTDPWYFHQFNANKKSLTVNLKTPRGLEIVRELLKKGDVMVENMAPGTIERLGLSYDAVKQLNPGIIYCQIKGFGQGSPYEKSLAFDMIAQAAGGMTSTTGYSDRPPVKPGTSFGDTGTGMVMAISILGALYKRQRTGQGRHLQLAMQDAMVHYMRVPFSR